ncbi:MAG TPA: septum formation initiator family protein [Alphaproteobacteria bacterium]|nr:septum formation initiator family protein [Alphaproteobacteria bacterium]
MVLLSEIKKRARHITGPVLAIAVFGYFAYHSIQGDRGLIAWMHLSQQIEIADANYEKVARERLALERRTNLLRPDHLDPDMLDERARASLGLVLPNEIVITNAPNAPAPMSLPAPAMPPAPVVETPRNSKVNAQSKGIAAHAAEMLPAVQAQAAQLGDLANKVTVSFAPAR